MSWKLIGISATILLLVAAGLSAFSGMNFWGSLLLVVCCTLINGYIATVEDDWPGGFNNPVGRSKTRNRVAAATEKFLGKFARSKR